MLIFKPIKKNVLKSLSQKDDLEKGIYIINQYSNMQRGERLWYKDIIFC